MVALTMRLIPVILTNLLNWSRYLMISTLKSGVRSRKAKWMCVYLDLSICWTSMVRHGRSTLKASK